MNTLITRIFTICLLIASISGLSAQNKDEKPLQNFQLSLFPGFGTDGLQTAENRYKTSINLFLGVNSGVQGLELGGFMNINNGTVEGLQLAGFGNVLNDDFQGLQGAGFMNIVAGDSRGASLAGFINATRGDQEGIAGAGFMNVVNGSSRSLNGAGFMNVVRNDYQGISGAGFMNVTGGNMEGIQGAGFMNVVRHHTRGIVGAGFANIGAGSVEGIQGAGFMNVATDITGIQAAGFLNVAEEVTGMQLGFINICDTITGIPIGFLSVVKKGGLRQIEIGANELGFVNATFKIGVPAFYNMFSLAWQPFGENNYVTQGYGIGTRFNLGYPSYLSLEANTSSIYNDWKIWEKYQRSLLNELRVLYTRNVADNVQLFAGITFYNHFQKTHSDEMIELSPYVMHEFTYKDWTSQWWTGARAGVNFVIR
jgi:hypothetical protein